MKIDVIKVFVIVTKRSNHTLSHKKRYFCLNAPQKGSFQGSPLFAHYPNLFMLSSSQQAAGVPRALHCILYNIGDLQMVQASPLGLPNNGCKLHKFWIGCTKRA